MKKTLSIILAVLMLLCVFAACGDKPAPETTTAEITTNEVTTAAGTTADDTTAAAAPVDPNAKDEGVLTYSQFIDLEAGKEVVIEGFLQAKYDFSESFNNTCLFLADGDGAYFVYRYGCTAEDYAKLEIGAKLKVSGTKAIYSGEVEVSDVTAVEVVGTDKYVADVLDVTASLGSEALINNMNKLVSVKGAEVVASKLEDKDVAFLYKWNGAGAQGDDIYFNIKVGEATYTFVVESDFMNKDSAAYKAAEALKIGDKIDIEGALYWYNGVQIQVTAIKAAN